MHQASFLICAQGNNRNLRKRVGRVHELGSFARSAEILQFFQLYVKNCSIRLETVRRRWTTRDRTALTEAFGCFLAQVKERGLVAWLVLAAFWTRHQQLEADYKIFRPMNRQTAFSIGNAARPGKSTET